ncbi:MAG: reverse transcriptase family protein [Bacteroidota bacterium]
MKLQEEQITYIREAFSSMKDKEGFLSLLNKCKVILYGEEAILFEMRHLNYHCNPKNNKDRYYSFNIRKKSGDPRTIHAPNKGLKALQKCLNLILQVIFQPHKAATGFILGKSVVDNAKIHTGKNYVYNIDLKDFFPSIEKARVYSRLKFPPFNLDNEKSKLANIIAGLCCQEMEVERLEAGQWVKKMEYVLPQGAPTSPTLTNIICERMDRRLAGAAKKNGLSYSRYADDITFSSNHNKYQKDGEFLKEVERIITDQNFIIKTEKTRLQKQGYRQEVTGLLVNSNVNVQQRYIKELRMWLYYWECYGYDRAYEFFLPRYKAEKGNVKKGKPNLENVLKGKLDYLKMVRDDSDKLYMKLTERFNKLKICGIEPSERGNHIEMVLNIFVKKGLDEAMILYKPIKTELNDNQ